MIVISATLVALAVWIVNRMLVRLLGNTAVITAVPLIEELFKTGSAVLLQVPLISLHGIFGILEGIYDLVHKSAFLPAVSGVLSHVLFGWLTAQLMASVGFWAAWIVVSFVHMLLNFFLLGYLNRWGKKVVK